MDLSLSIGISVRSSLRRIPRFSFFGMRLLLLLLQGPFLSIV